MFEFSVPPAAGLFVFATAFQTGSGEVLTTIGSAHPTDEVGAPAQLHGVWGIAQAAALGIGGAGPNDVFVGLLLREGWTIENIDQSGHLTYFVLGPLFGPGNVVAADFGSSRGTEHRYFQLSRVEGTTATNDLLGTALWHHSRAQTLGRNPVSVDVDLALLFLDQFQIYVAVPCITKPGAFMCRFSAAYPGLGILGPATVYNSVSAASSGVTGLVLDDWVISGFFDTATPL